MLATTKLGDIDIIVKDHPFLNFCEGIVYSPELINLTEDEITTELSSYHVVGTRRIMKRVLEKIEPTPLIVLKFDMQRIPNSIVSGFIRLKIRQYYPNPMRCVKCQAFGHTKNRCVNNIVCAKCSVEGEHTECTSTKCFNCNGPHGSFDRKCPKFIEESAIIKIKIDERVPQPEAVRRYNQRNSVPGRESFANVVSSNPGQSSDTSMDELKLLFQKEAKLSADRQAILEVKLEAQVMESLKLRKIIENQNIQIQEQQKLISSLQGKQFHQQPQSSEQHKLLLQQQPEASEKQQILLQQQQQQSQQQQPQQHQQPQQQQQPQQGKQQRKQPQQKQSQKQSKQQQLTNDNNPKPVQGTKPTVRHTAGIFSDSENSDSSNKSSLSDTSKKPFVFKKPINVSLETKSKHPPIIMFPTSLSIPSTSAAIQTVDNEFSSESNNMVIDSELGVRESFALSHTET